MGLGLGRHREADRHAVAVELKANTVLGGEASQQGGQRARDLVSLGAVVDEEVLGGGELGGACEERLVRNRVRVRVRARARARARARVKVRVRARG